MSKLRSLGLVAPRTKTEIARKLPVLKAPALVRAVNRFKDVLSGTAGVVRRSEIDISNKEARKRGLRAVPAEPRTERMVVVPKFKGETVRARNRSLEYSSPEGTRIQRLELPPVRHDTLGNFFTDLKKININKLEKDFPGYQIGVRFYSGRTVLFSPKQLKYMLNKINAYDTVVGAHGRKQTADVIRNIELILVPRADAETWYAEKRRKK